MLYGDLIDLRVREVSADALDAIRPLARRHGFRHTNADVVRFAVGLADAVRRRIDETGTLEGLGVSLDWPRPRPRKSCRRRPQTQVEMTLAALDQVTGTRVEFP